MRTMKAISKERNKISKKIPEEIPQEIIDMASDIHGHMSPGLTAGLKMIFFGLKKLEITPNDKIFIVSESVRCLQDAAYAVTNYFIKENGWRIYSRCYDVGKFSIQIMKNFKKEKGKHSKKTHPDDQTNNSTNSNTEEMIFRVILNEIGVKNYPMFYKWAYQTEKEKAPLKELLADINRAKDDEIFKIIPFTGQMNKYCHISNKNLIKCAECGESVEKVTTLEIDGKLVCRVCAFFEK